MNDIRFLWTICLALFLSFAITRGDDKAMIDKARLIHARALTIDTHCDTPLHMSDSTFDIGVRHQTGVKGSGKLDLPRMREGGLDAQFFAVFVAQRDRTEENNRWAKAQADTYLALVKKMCEKYNGIISFATTPEDAYRNEKAGRLSAYVGLENGFALGRDLANVSRLYQAGVRYITLCHTKNNDICDSSTDSQGPEHNGLSVFGAQVVTEMNRLGMIIDVSHVSDSTFYDVLRLSKAPVIASHSCARALCNNPRNLSDQMLQALAAKGGVVQICFMSDYLKAIKPNPDREAAIKALEEKYGPMSELKSPQKRRQYRTEYYEINEKYPREKATVQDVVDHIEHVIRIVGVDYVGIGTDVDGGGDISGCEDVSEMPNITIELVKRGHSEAEIRKIWGENFMRVFRMVEEASHSY